MVTARSTGTNEEVEVKPALKIICDALNKQFEYMKIEKDWIIMFYKSKLEQEDECEEDEDCINVEKERYEINGDLYNYLYTNKIEYWIDRENQEKDNDILYVQLSLL